MLADRAVEDFQGTGPQHTPGHEEIEIALLRLYQPDRSAVLPGPGQAVHRRAWAQHRFRLSLLRQAASSIQRGKHVNKERQDYRDAHPETATRSLPEGNYAKRPWNSNVRWLLNALTGKFFQQHMPVRQQTVPVGHAVRFGYLETSIAMLIRFRQDESFLPALQAAWERMVIRRMYVTGGLGSLPDLEGFGDDYELDPEYAYAETCAALASILWNREMGSITGEAKYSDLTEWQLYNAASVGMGWSGRDYLYNNPLAARGGVRRKPWYAVPCCPSNLSRTFADLGETIYAKRGAMCGWSSLLGVGGLVDWGMVDWGLVIRGGVIGGMMD